jgi:FkbM family methyltransferase
MFLIGDQIDQWGLDRCLSESSGKTFIDIGAHKGGFTVTFLEHGARQVIAVEPGPNLSAGMRERFLDSPVTVIQSGVSDKPGKLIGVTYYNAWTLAKPGVLTGRIAELSPDGIIAEGSEPFDVTLTTLDALVSDLKIDDLAFVKIDVDGYEPQVLRGGARTMRELRPYIFIELSYLPHDMGESVNDFIGNIYDSGYRLATFHGQVASAQQVIDNFPWHTSFDMLMVPVERCLDWPRL